MIRILHSVSNMDRAGIETMLMNYYRNIDRDNVQFDFLCNKKVKGAYDDEIKKLGGNVYYSPGFNPLKIKKYIGFLKKIKEENKDMEIIHAHNASLSAYTLFCAKKAGFNIRIAHSHSTRIPSTKKIKLFDPKWLYKSLLKKFVTMNSVKNIACGEEAGNFLFGKKEYKLIRNCIDIKKFKFSEENRKNIRKKYKINDDIKVIGHVGRFNVVKNHKFIIDMFLELVKKQNDNKYKLFLIGDGELKEEIIQYTKKLGLENYVIFVDNTSDVNKFYSAMDFFVLPSKFEGIPVVGIEAQTAGVKCLFSDKISKEAKIVDETLYLGISKKDIYKWIEVIENTNLNDRSSKIEKVKEYDIYQNVNKLITIYNELINLNKSEVNNEN